MMSFSFSNFKALVLVTSDTCSKDPTQDQSGLYVQDQLKSLEFNHVDRVIVEDDKLAITNTISAALKDPQYALIITVGGTGLTPRDVTPESTSAFYDRYCTGISTSLLMTSLRYSSHASLSCQTAGIAGNCLIVNFPGKLKACKECFLCLEKILVHALEQVRFDPESIKLTHSIQDAAAYSVVPSSSLLASKDQVIPEVKSSKIDRLEPDCEASKISDKSEEATIDSSGDKFDDSSEIAMARLKQLFVTPPGKKLTEESCVRQTRQKSSRLEASLNNGQPPTSHHRLSDLNLDQLSSKLGLNTQEDGAISPLANIKEPVTESPYPLVELEEAFRIMNSIQFTKCSNVEVRLDTFTSISSLLGNLLAVDIVSKTKIPPFHASTMDGYVLHVPQAMKHAISKVSSLSARIVADLSKFQEMQNDPEQELHFFCYRINTGGRLPEENFAVIPVEKTQAAATGCSVTILEVKPDHFIRAAGSDVSDSEIIAEAGDKIGPVELALLVSSGCESVTIVEKPFVAILSTGDELVESTERQSEGDRDKVIDTNGPLLTSLLKTRGFRSLNYGICKDNPKEILFKIQSSLSKCDILIVTGGASMGSKDHVKDVIEQMGGVIHFGRVNIKPGKPAAMATLKIDGKRKFVFSLPGNPVSAYITCLVLVMPFLERWIRNHLKSDLPISLSAIGDVIEVEIGFISDLSEDKQYIFDGRFEFVRGKMLSLAAKDGEERGTNQPQLVTVSAKQQSSRLLNLKDCDCLIMIDPSLKDSKFLVGQTYPALKLKS